MRHFTLAKYEAPRCGHDSDEQPIADRIAELKRRLRELGGDMAQFGTSPDCPPEIEEQFLRNVLAFEEAERMDKASLLDQLLERGVVLPEPETLDDAALHSVLWKVILTLAEMKTYLISTDHLSDRELYTRLWKDCLRDLEARYDPQSSWVSFIDLVSSGSDEDAQAFLRFYADEDIRGRWQSEFPEDPMPESSDLPYDRDRHLPSPEGWSSRVSQADVRGRPRS